LQDGDVVDEPQAERGEVVGPVLGCRQHHELELRVHTQAPDHEGRRNPALAHTTEGFGHAAARAVLEPAGDVELDRGGVGQTEVTPDQDEEGAEVPELVRQGSELGG